MQSAHTKHLHSEDKKTKIKLTKLFSLCTQNHNKEDAFGNKVSVCDSAAISNDLVVAIK